MNHKEYPQKSVLEPKHFKISRENTILKLCLVINHNSEADPSEVS